MKSRRTIRLGESPAREGWGEGLDGDELMA
jgi:hypothetical protein